MDQVLIYFSSQFFQSLSIYSLANLLRPHSLSFILIFIYLSIYLSIYLFFYVFLYYPNSMCLYIYSSIISLFSCLFILFLSKINEYFGSPWLILYFLNISRQPLLFFIFIIFDWDTLYSIKPKDFETPWIPFWILNIWTHPTYRLISFLWTNNNFENEQYFWERTKFT